MTYQVAGVQYVALMEGYGGGAIATTFPPFAAGASYLNEGRIVAFRLGGGAVPLPPARPELTLAEPPAPEGTPADIARGSRLYHGPVRALPCLGAGVLPDLRTAAPADLKQFEDIVLQRRADAAGHGQFDDVLSEADAAALTPT